MAGTRVPEKICAKVDPSVKQQAITLARAVVAMQAMIEKQIPVYQDLPLSQTVTTGAGKKVQRTNPAAVEFRALVKDYSATLRDLTQIVDTKSVSSPELSVLDGLQKRFKVG